MEILIIGGTKFLGRHLIDAALENDHEVTLFNRGRNYADEKIADVEQIHGDRNDNLEKLGGRSWDAVIDTCGYLPQTVKASAEFLKDKVNQYVFISSGSVDLPRIVCTFRVLKRIWHYRNNIRPDMAEGCEERFDWEFIKYVWRFQKEKNPAIKMRLAKFADSKKIIHLKSDRDIKIFFKDISGN